MDQLIALWPYAVAALAGIVVGLATYAKLGGKGWKNALKAVVAGVGASKKKLDEQGIDYKENLTTLINEKVEDPKAKAILDSVIDIVEREASASASAPETTDAGSSD